MAYTDYLDTVQKSYIGYYQRPADPSGLIYWATRLNAAGGDQSAIIAAFSTSPEKDALYGTISNSNIGTVVDDIYMALFGRVAEAAGKAYYVNGFNAGTFTAGTIMLNILDGATTGNDFLSVQNKLAASIRFTETIDPGLDGSVHATYDGNADNAAARTWLTSVTWNTVTVPTQSETTAFIQTSVANTGDLILQTSGGQTFTLTAGADSGLAFTGTGANDTFMGTYDAVAATDTFGATDVLDGGAGTADTLDISHLIDVDITPPDALWTGIRNIEKIIINTTGNGAQTIITGTKFDDAFKAAGVNLTTTTSGSGAIDITMTSFTGASVLTTESIAGAQTIITSNTGAATVDATSVAGALVIKGVGLTEVTALTTGAGAQTIGDAGGNGSNLVSVNATSNSGAQTITSTSISAVTVTATSTSGLQTIVTGEGSDSVTATAAAGTTNTITTNAGDDTIVASLGTDLITGGLGADKMTGGGAIDTFVFGANGSVIGTSMDIITDFNTAGADVLSFSAATTLLAADSTALVAGSGAGSNVQTTAGGMIIFAGADNTLLLKTAAVQADAQLDAAGSVAMFVDSGNTYLYYAGTTTGNSDDQLIQLIGIDTLVMITSGATTTIA